MLSVVWRVFYQSSRHTGQICLSILLQTIFGKVFPQCLQQPLLADFFRLSSCLHLLLLVTVLISHWTANQKWRPHTHLQIGCDSQAALCLWGFATASDKHRIEAFVRHGVRLQFYGAADPTPTQLAEDADETLFSRIRRNRHHVLLRPRRHNFSLSTKTDDWNFIIRQLFSDSYWCVVTMTIVYLYISYPNVHSCGLSNCSIKLYYYYYWYYHYYTLTHRQPKFNSCQSSTFTVSV